MKIYKTTCIVTALLFFFLFYTLQFEPAKLCADLGIEANEVSDFLAKRASILMLGFGVLLILAINIKERISILAVSFSIAVCMLGLACMSGQEFLRGFVNNGILPALIIETIIGLTFLILGLLKLKEKYTIPTKQSK